MKLTAKQLKQLRSIGHRLHPVVIISKGLSDNINTEINRALSDHELIKVKVNAAERVEKKLIVDEICELRNATLVQLIGNIALLYRPAEKPSPKLSNLLRHRELLS